MRISQVPTEGVTTDREIKSTHRRFGPTDDWTTVWTRTGPGWGAWALATVLSLAIAAAAGIVPPTALAVGATVPAALVDLHERRLPDGLLSIAAGALLVGIVCSDGIDFAAVAAGAGSMAGPLLVLHLASPASMGFGDVKAAAVLGAAAGTVHWQLGLTALALAAGASATAAVVTHRRTIAFGPGLVTGAAIATIFHPLFLATGSGQPVARVADEVRSVLTMAVTS